MQHLFGTLAQNFKLRKFRGRLPAGHAFTSIIYAHTYLSGTDRIITNSVANKLVYQGTALFKLISSMRLFGMTFYLRFICTFVVYLDECFAFLSLYCLENQFLLLRHFPNINQLDLFVKVLSKQTHSKLFIYKYKLSQKAWYTLSIYEIVILNRSCLKAM